MGEKSHVTMKQEMCPVCGEVHDSGAILLDKMLRKKFERTTTTGYALCPVHEEMYKQGYVALVGIDPAKSTVSDGTVKMEGVYRTGRVAHIKQSAWGHVLNVPVPKEGGKARPVVFVDDAVIQKLEDAQGAEDSN